MKYHALATCAFGLESVLAFELKKLGLENIKTSDGRIEFDASNEDIARANINLRTAERVLIVLGQWPASTFDELFDGLFALPLEEFVEREDIFPVKGYTMNSKLTSVPACQAILKKAAAKRLGKAYGLNSLPESGPATKRLRFALVGDVCTFMLDTSGDGLHKRGYRPLLNEAPIKETLAAGICDFARVFPESEVCDPFCGSGTLLIEAAMRAKNIAPGLKRSFAGEGYTFLGKSSFKRAREEARALVRADAAFTARGLDIDRAAVDIAAQNAARAGVADCVSFSQADARTLTVNEREIILANPPYGERLMQESEVDRLYKDFGKNLFKQRFKGFYIISNSAEFEALIGKTARRRRKLYNGMIPCQLYMYF